MKLLVLGGTRFLGRHFVDAALARGDIVTLFNRGKHPHAWGDAVTDLLGERDPAIAPGLAALADGEWDAVVDFCGYVPRCVRASAGILRDRSARYLFVSSVSVYAATDRPGTDETAAVGELPDASSEDVAKYYGPLKAACEREVERIYGADALIVRPGLIVGPHDPTDRFSYWVARLAAPALLGDRAEEAVVPAPPDRPIQVIDARDLAAWMRTLLEDKRHGTFNACSPAGHWTMQDLVTAAAAVRGPGGPRPAWVDDATLLAHKVEPWVGLPLWLPASMPEYAGFMAIDAGKAVAAGLVLRPLAATVADTAAWLQERPAGGAFAAVLDADTERALLAAARPTPGTH
jgi:2'-hydroxyisoflavone reductase